MILYYYFIAPRSVFFLISIFKVCYYFFIGSHDGFFQSSDENDRVSSGRGKSCHCCTDQSRQKLCLPWGDFYDLNIKEDCSHAVGSEVASISLLLKSTMGFNFKHQNQDMCTQS